MADVAKKAPDSGAIGQELEKILASEAFTRSERLRSFLKFTVERSASGRQDQLKEYVIGLEVYRKGASFDPRSDSTVRVEASRLRNKLREYYADEGREDPVRID